MQTQPDSLSEEEEFELVKEKQRKPKEATHHKTHHPKPYTAHEKPKQAKPEEQKPVQENEEAKTTS